jgi:hypothetical protein
VKNGVSCIEGVQVVASLGSIENMEQEIVRGCSIVPTTKVLKELNASTLETKKVVIQLLRIEDELYKFIIRRPFQGLK